MKQVLPSGDEITINRACSTIRFTGQRRVLSTSALNGGLRSDLTAVYNHNDTPCAAAWCEMKGETLAAHQLATVESLGLSPATTTGLHTAANINNTAIEYLRFEGFSVTAVITAGLGGNASRVGSPATLQETGGRAEVLSGTINIILLIDACLTDNAMVRGLVTCTEAKTAALQELLVGDVFGSGLATGSGTDGTVIVTNPNSPTRLSEAGGSFKLGELIGRTVLAGVKKALYRQSGLGTEHQHNLFRRLERFGVIPDNVWEEYLALTSSPLDKSRFDDIMAHVAKDGSVVTISSLYAHLMDQLSWGLILPQEAHETGEKLLGLLGEHTGVHPLPVVDYIQPLPAQIESMAAAFVSMLARWIKASE